MGGGGGYGRFFSNIIAYIYDFYQKMRTFFFNFISVINEYYSVILCIYGRGYMEGGEIILSKMFIFALIIVQM